MTSLVSLVAAERPGISQHARRDTILQFFLEVVESSGLTHEQKLLGARGINTIEPKNIEAILSTQFTDFDLGLRPVHFYPLLGSGIFTQDGGAWKHSRELLRPQFASNRYQNFEEIRKCVESLIDQIPDGKVVDLQPLFFRLTFGTTTFLLFGETTSSLQSAEVASQESEFAEAFNLGQEYLSSRGRLGDLYWVLNTPGFRKAYRTTHKFVDDAVQSALDAAESKASKPDRYVFIDALIHQTQDKKALRDQCLNVLLAGRDTTACCLTWAMRLLARHPQVWPKVRQEIEQIAGLGSSATQPTREDIRKMVFLNQVIKETLQLYPSVPVNSRAAVRTTTIPTGGGTDGQSPILVRKGEAVGYCPYAMHRRKDIYGKDALEFQPERWNGDALKDVGYGYLPFNGGPRLCLGQDFAMLDASYTIARIAQKFETLALPALEKAVDIGEERQTLTLVVSCAEGCRLICKRAS